MTIPSHFYLLFHLFESIKHARSDHTNEEGHDDPSGEHDINGKEEKSQERLLLVDRAVVAWEVPERSAHYRLAVVAIGVRSLHRISSAAEPRSVSDSRPADTC